jgi:hypothetical protein
MNGYSAEFVRACELKNLASVTVLTATILGEACDRGLITLDEVIELVHNCSDLGGELSTLAATVAAVMDQDKVTI